MANLPNNKDNRSVILSTRVMPETLTRLKHEARKHNLPVSNIVATIIHSALTTSKPADSSTPSS
jgi:hypothetical protein